jgi:hypothetical protein
MLNSVEFTNVSCDSSASFVEELEDVDETVFEVRYEEAEARRY